MRRDGRRDGNATVLKKIALPIAHVVALVCCANDEIVSKKSRITGRRVGQSHWCIIYLINLFYSMWLSFIEFILV